MSITYDAVACQVWLDPISIGPVGGQPLCGDHAGRLSAPRGWVVMDRRTSQAALLTPALVPEPPVARARRRLPRGWGQFEAPRLEFVAEAAPPEAAVVDPVATDPEPTPIAVAERERTPEPSAVAVAPAVEREPFATAVPVPEPEPESEAVVEPVVEAVVESEAVVEPESEPVVEAAPEPEPVASARRSGRGGTKPRGRLLSRAFESTGHQRSVITDSLGRDDEASAD